MPVGEVGPGGPGHALMLTFVTNVTEVGALPSCRVHPGDRQYYDPVGLPLGSVWFHHWLIPTVFADEAAKTGLSCSEPNRAYVPLPVPRGDPTIGISGTGQSVGRGPSPWYERLGSPVVNVTRLQDSCRVALRPTRLLPPKRLLTPRSARNLSIANRGLLLGSPAITQVGLAPTGLVQFSGRNIKPSYRHFFTQRSWSDANVRKAAAIREIPGYGSRTQPLDAWSGSSDLAGARTLPPRASPPPLPADRRHVHARPRRRSRLTYQPRATTVCTSYGSRTLLPTPPAGQHEQHAPTTVLPASTPTWASFGVP
jgi:hypothetical protein